MSQLTENPKQIFENPPKSRRRPGVFDYNDPNCFSLAVGRKRHMPIEAPTKSKDACEKSNIKMPSSKNVQTELSKKQQAKPNYPKKKTS